MGGGAAFILLLVWGVFQVGWSAVGWTLTIVWGLVNLSVAGYVALWGLFHPRAVLKANQTITVWAIWVAVLVALAVPGFLESSLAQRGNAAPSTSLLLISALSAFMFTLISALASGYIGASFGALFSSHTATADDNEASSGVTLWWMVQIIGLLITNYFGAYLLRFVPFLILFSTPVICWGLCRRLRAWLSRSGQPLQTSLNQWTRRLTLRRTRGQKTVTYDFRGAALGLTAGIIALLISTSNVFIPLQSWTLLWLIQFRNAPLLSGADALNLRVFQTTKNTAEERFVRLVFDDSTQRQMLTESSESKIQAQTILQLKQWGVSLIVLPLPMIEPQRAISRFEPGVDNASAKRALEDLPLLANGARKAGNVILAIRRVEDMISDEDASNRAKIEEVIRKASGQLGASVRAVGSADFTGYHSAQLPTMLIPGAKASRVPCAPWFLMSVEKEGTVKPLQADQLPELAQELPQIEEGQVLVDFQGTRAGHAFLQIPYNAVLNKEKVFRGSSPNLSPNFSISVADSGATVKDQTQTTNPANPLWEPPATFFKDKIVFLDSMDKRPVETPLGIMTHAELLTHAAATVWDQSYVGRVNPWWRIALIIALCILVGHVCRGLTPLSAAWRVATLAFVMLLTSIAAFLFFRLWLGPVVPIVGMIGASALVTQLTFSLEKTERARNRALLQRFVAPQIVEELLDDPYHQLGLGGTRQSVCVLFADVRNFTPFASTHSPEEVVEAVNSYLGAMTEALHAHGGLLDKYLGDGLMALFRLGENPEEDLQRAVKAAIAMQQAALKESIHLQEQGKDALGVGIGLHAGEAVVGLVGNKDQFNYTALGQTVILSQRLQALASAGEIALSETVYQAVVGQYPVFAEGETELKGLSEPIRTYRLRVSDLESL